MSTSRFDFSRNKYEKELLIDCFLKSQAIELNEPTDPYQVSFYELIFITEGSGKFLLDNEVIEFYPGMVLLLPPNKWRQWTEINQPFDAYFLLFVEEHVSTFFNDPLYLYRFHYFYNIEAPSYLTLDENGLDKISERLNEIRQEIKSLRPDSSHFLRSLLYYLLISLNRQYESQHSINRSFYKEVEVLKFRKLLEEHIHIKQRVNDYAELMGISTSHLNKLLKTYFGKSCSEIIKERLIIEIKKRLLFSDKNISEISHALGFSELSNFSRFCQQHLNMAPKEYRLQNDKS